MPTPSNYWNLDRVMRLLFVVAGAVAALWLVVYLTEVLIPFGIAFLLAYMLDPLVGKVQKKVRSRSVAALLVLLGFFVLLGGAIALLMPTVVNQMVHLGELLTRMVNDAAWRDRLAAYIPTNWRDQLLELLSRERVLSALQNADFWSYAQAALAKLLPGAWGVLEGSARALAWLVGLVIILMNLFFMLVEFGQMRKYIAELVPKAYQVPVYAFTEDADRIMGQYFRAQALVSVIMAVLFALGFSIMGLPMGLPFGILVGLMAMVPYLQLLSIPPALFLSLIYSLDTGMPFWQVVLIVLAIYGVVQLIQDMVLVPRIMGGALGLSPVAILLSLSVWGKLLGAFGIIMAIPFTCILLATSDRVRKAQRE